MKANVKCFVLLCICISLSAVFSGCAGNTDGNTVYATNMRKAIISNLLPGYIVAECRNGALDLLQTGAAIEAYDIQAIGALESGLAEYWYPLTLETVVIAIDRNMTDLAISSWNDLQRSNEHFSITNTPPANRMVAGALCYGLEGADFTLGSAVELLELLNARKLLKYDDSKAPIQICFDSEAAGRIKKGENIEIIIPSEGTLTYSWGLLSVYPLALSSGSRQVLFDSGFRLLDGRCNADIFPAPEQYISAKTLDDYSRLNDIMQDWLRTLRRDILHLRLYTSADSREHILFAAVFIIITAVWVCSLMLRSRQKNIRRVILTAGILLSMWVIVRILKYQIIAENALTRYLWYVFYFFEACIPLLMLRIAALVGTGSDSRRISKWFIGICSFNLVLVILVMTNDLHGLVFKLDLTQPGWSENGNYGYGILFYAITAVLVVELIAGISIMFVKSRHSPRRLGIIFPFIFVAVLITYVIEYAAQTPFFSESDVTLVYSAFTLLFLELCVQTGQIPVNVHYRKIFRNAGLKLQITDDCGNSVFLPKGFEPLDMELWNLLRDSKTPVHTGENTLMLKKRISGGYAVWQEDVSAINKLKAEIEAANHELETGNNFLLHKTQTEEQTAQARARVELYAAFEKNIAEYERQLSEMLRSPPSDEREFSIYIGILAVLVCYIKRRFNLLISELSGNKTIPFNEFVVYIDEQAEFIKLAGIRFMAYCDLMGEIDTQYAILLYDFFHSIAEWSFEKRITDSLVKTMSEGGRIVMKLMLPQIAMEYELPSRLEGEVSLARGLFEKDDQSDTVVIKLSFPARSISDD